MSLLGLHGVLDDIGRFAGKAARNPIVQGAVGAFVPGGPLIAGGLAALGRGSQPGANFGDIAKAGVTGFGAGEAGSGIRNLAGKGLSALGGGAPSAPSIPALSNVPAPIPGAELATDANFSAGGLGSIPSGVAPSPATASGGSTFGNAARGLGSFVKEYPGLSKDVLGGVAGAFGPEGRIQNAEADSLAFDLEQRKRRQADLEAWYQGSPHAHGVG